MIVRFPPSLDSVMLSSPAAGLPSAVVDTVPKLTPPAPKFSNRIVPPPAVVSVVTTTAVARALSMLTFPLVELSAVIVAPDSSSGVVFPIPVAAFRSIVDAVTRPAPLIAATELIVTSSAAAVVVPVRITLPLVVVVSVTFAVPPAVTLVPTVRFPPIASRSTSPLPVVTVVNTAAPVLSTVMVPVPVVTVVNVAAIALLMSMLPLVVSAVIVAPDSSSAVAFPIPVAAFRSIVAAVTRPAPLIEPTLLSVTLPPLVVRLLLSVIPFVALRLTAMIRPVSAATASVTVITSATTLTLPVAVAEPSVAAAFQLTASVPSSPLIVTAARNDASIEVSVIVSSPVPALIVRLPLGLVK